MDKTSNVRSKFVAAAVDILTTAVMESTYSASGVHKFCDFVAAQCKGESVADVERDAMLNLLGQRLHWVGKVGATRKSEYAAIIATYKQLGNGIDNVMASVEKGTGKKAKRLYMADIVRMARLIKNGSSAVDAAKAVITAQNKPKGEADPKALVTRLKKALATIADASRSADKKKAIQACIAVL